MKFTTVCFENLFAYEGPANFDVSTKPGKNIVLIWGRNGMGKTSFLNGVRLLFTGMEDTEFRRVGFPPKSPAIKQYLLGDGASWTGVINRAARRRAVNLGKPLEAKVEISWLADDGKSYTATRWWVVEGDQFSAGLKRYFSSAIVKYASARLHADKGMAKILDSGLFWDFESRKALVKDLKIKIADADCSWADFRVELRVLVAKIRERFRLLEEANRTNDRLRLLDGKSAMSRLRHDFKVSQKWEGHLATELAKKPYAREFREHLLTVTAA